MRQYRPTEPALLPGILGIYYEPGARIQPRIGVAPMPPESPIVFVVDDDISVRELLERLIQNEGWQPETFASAQEFLDRPRALVPSCLILDVSLPGLNGLELEQTLAAEPTHMPIIFITGHGDIPTRVRAMKAGAVDFFNETFQR
jgi:FixJ family two-component response regulator